MTYQFKSRAESTYAWKQAAIAVCADYPAEDDVRAGVDYANDSLAGTLGAPPATPTLTIKDNGDGTATVTISDSDEGTTNTLYTATPFAGEWSEAGDRIGDGDVVLTLDPGAYWCYCRSENSDAAALSEVAGFHVTDSVADQYATAAQNIIKRIVVSETTIRRASN